MKPPFASMTFGLAVGVTAAVVVASAGGAWLYAQHHMRTLLSTARTAAMAEGNLIRIALEHQMIENDRTLIARMIAGFRKQARVGRLVVLDRTGTERYPDAAQGPAADLRISSPTCQACHQYAPSQRDSSRVVETSGGSVLRTVIPIRNREECYRCHDPAHKINGILILDYDAEELRAEMHRDLGWLVAGTAAITLLLVGAIGLIIRIAVLRRLQRFETAARQIAAGDLARRVPASNGSDTLSWMAREFNTMADSVTGLVSEVRHQRERLENVINSIDDGIVVLDAERHIIAANDAFLDRVGHSREEALSCCCRDLSAGGCTVQDCPAAGCMHSGVRQVRICERTRPDGSPVCEEVHASPVLDDSGKLTHVVEVWRDITERRAAEARLAESHRLASLGMLASGFSHEMNTPLATVLTCVEGILKSVEPGQDRIRDNAQVAREQILRCRTVTQHFLRMARGQRTEGDIVDLGSAIAAVGRLVEPTARAHSVRVDMAQVPPGLHVRADEAELQHALINLLLNAIQACRPGGCASVRVEADEEIRIRVSDNGCGIPPENRKRIFEPFVSGRQGGTGLGLFLSMNFVRRWGGDIRVESTMGEGSSFEVVLPAMVARVETPA